MRTDGRKIKFSSRCGWTRDGGCRRRALKWSTGSYDAYCREHKRQHAREYMREYRRKRK